MKAEWSKPKPIDKILPPSKPGVYLIMRKKAIKRIGKVDRKGILYIGQAYDLKSRLRLFRKSEHIASWFLYGHPEVAQFVLGRKLKRFDDPLLGKLWAKVTLPENEFSKVENERAVGRCNFRKVCSV